MASTTVVTNNMPAHNLGEVGEDQRPLLRLESLNVSFGRDPLDRPVVRDVSLELRPGRCLGIVGESGSGKSVTARTLIGLTGATAKIAVGGFEFEGQDVSGFKDRDWRRIRGREIGFVSQDALVSLDQLRKVGREVGEGLKLHRAVRGKAALEARVVELLTQVDVPDAAVKARQLPHELSGGQRQRALIASALALDPQILIADEPTTALDATVQAQVLQLLAATRDRGKALIIISHDLAVVSQMADEVLVMRHGEVVERGAAEAVLSNPQHEYTQRLLDAVPSGHSRGARLSHLEAPRAGTLAQFGPRHAARAAAEEQDHSGAALLEVDGVVKRFRGPDRVLRTAVQDVSFSLGAGETLGIVGESGSGKSTTARIVMALESPDAGEVALLGRPWSTLTERARRDRRHQISIIYQDPLSSFDPRWSIQRIVQDSVATHVDGEGDQRRRVGELLDLVGLPRALHARRPLELSGGQRQRVAIARAIAPSPSVIVCDEPVSGLDVSIQAQVLDLLVDLRDQLKVSYLFISHDLGVVHHISDRVLVMNQGRVVEHGDAEDVLRHPSDPYTQKLVAAVPRLRHVRGDSERLAV
jgi:peptide/nickel transport system ATP-binding protein